MATNMKTIKFGENGEVYAVNAPAVQVSGTLGADSQYIDFGTFADGLTEVECYFKCPANSAATGTYFYMVANEVQSHFMSFNFKGEQIVKVYMKKIGGIWTGESRNGITFSDDFAKKVLIDGLDGVDSITSLRFKAYGNDTFPAGTVYVMEGR